MVHPTAPDQTCPGIRIIHGLVNYFLPNTQWFITWYCPSWHGWVTSGCCWNPLNNYSSRIVCRFYSLLGHLAILFSGPPKPEACWSGRNWDKCEERILSTGARYGKPSASTLGYPACSISLAVFCPLNWLPVFFFNALTSVRRHSTYSFWVRASRIIPSPTVSGQAPGLVGA